jgi:YbbR domain-containing protein
MTMMRLRVLRSPPQPAEEPGPGSERPARPTPPWRRLLRVPRPRELRDGLRRNTGLKLVSLVLAFLLWFAINVSERDAEIDISVPVTTQHLSSDLIVVEKKPVKPVSVTVRGPRTILEGVDGRRMRLVVDLAQASAGETRKVELNADMLKPELPRRLKAVRYDPGSVTVRVARLLRRKLPVRVVVEGNPPLGYTVTAAARPTEVEVSGPARRVEAMAALKTEPINVSTLTQSATREVPLVWAGDFIRVAQNEVVVTLAVKEIMMSRDFNRVEVEVLHPEPGRARVKPSQVDLTLVGPMRLLEPLRLEPGTATVDAAQLEPGSHEVKVSVNVADPLKVGRIVPEEVRVEIRGPEKGPEGR